MTSLSTDGSEDLEPKKSSANVSRAASAAACAAKAAVLAVSASFLWDKADAAELAAFVSALNNPDASTEKSNPLPELFTPNSLPATKLGNVISKVFDVVAEAIDEN